MNKSDKNVLMISQLFPPISGVGALRTAFFSKYLPTHGWNPIILTTRYHSKHSLLDVAFPGLPSANNIIRVSGAEEETGKDLISKLKRFPYKTLIPELCGLRNFYHRMFTTLRDICRSKRIDVIYASSGPEVVHCLAAKAHKEFCIPWIADFRDILEQWPPRRLIDRWQWALLRRRQSRICSSAECFITVSNGFADQLQSRLGRTPIVITNGFDDLMYVPNSCSISRHFTITYTGSLYYNSHTGPETFLKALDIAIVKGDIESEFLRVLFVGTESEILSKITRNFRCSDRIDELPRVNYLHSLELQRKSCILLHFSHQTTKGILTTKLYEYLGARRPIISIPGDDKEVHNLLRTTNSGISCADVDSIVRILSNWYKEWKRTGNVLYRGREEQIAKYTRRTQAEQLANILDQVI